ncbi:hypothetical protein GZL_01013 [Streptomyces sp. 769]|nr:hypothetical protein GZL_01013 [Streptomyces sp. 769]
MGNSLLFGLASARLAVGAGVRPVVAKRVEPPYGHAAEGDPAPTDHHNLMGRVRALR